MDVNLRSKDRTDWPVSGPRIDQF